MNAIPKLTVVDNDPKIGGLTVAERRIRDSARYINKRVANLQAGEAWLDIGRELAEVKEFLKKNSPRDDKHGGWLAAFKGTVHLPFQRSYADRLIAVHKALSGTGIPPRNLPASVSALLVLANLPEAYRARAAEQCNPSSTATDVKRIAKALGIPAAKKRKVGPRREFATIRNAFCTAILKLPDAQRIIEFKKLASELGIEGWGWKKGATK